MAGRRGGVPPRYLIVTEVLQSILSDRTIEIVHSILKHKLSLTTPEHTSARIIIKHLRVHKSNLPLFLYLSECCHAFCCFRISNIESFGDKQNLRYTLAHLKADTRP